MKNSRLTLAASILLLGTGAGLAVPANITGTITSLDKGKHQVVLDDGQTYSLQADIKADNLAVGDRVTVSSEKKDGANVVASIAKR
jgi:hypothetical protein